MPTASQTNTIGTDERELIRRARAGDDRAFELLLNKYSKRIFEYCKRMVADTAVAEDLAQEAFVKFYFALPKFDAAKPVTAFLFRIAHNLCIDWYRKKKLLTTSLTAGEDEDEPEVLEIADDKLAPDVLARRAEVQAAIDEALASLPATYRSSLVLRYREGLSYEEIAAVTNLPVGTIKSHIHRGRRILQQKLSLYV